MRLMIVRLVAFGWLTAVQPEADPWSWVSEVEQDVWAGLRRSVEVPVDVQTTKWSVVIEANNGWGGTAVLQLGQPWKGRAWARLASLRGKDLSGVLHDLKESKPELAASDIPALMPAVETIQGCAELDRVAKRVETVKVPALSANYLALHAAGFKVTMSPTLRHDTRFEVDTHENDLARWAEDALKIADRCLRPPARD